MCGIFGCCITSFTREELLHRCEQAAQAITHRGPDDRGVWANDHGIGLSHRRLSILDLSPQGAQPFTSPQRKQKLVYNGEIYNYRELRNELENDLSYSFRSTGDTEVLSLALETWGIESTVTKLNGMFAFSLWNPEQQTLTLVRDRIGIKPLYYGWNRLGFFFASELKAFFSFPEWRAPLSDEALSLYFQHGYITAPYSIFDGFYKLPPGTTLTLGLEDLKNRPSEFSPHAVDSGAHKRANPVSYWKCPPAEVSNAASERSDTADSYLQAQDELKELLTDSLRKRMISDVPVGAFLSGGIDSSLVVSLLAAANPDLIKTFSIGFKEEEYNEAPFAKQIADHLGTEHTELYVNADQALEVIPDLSLIYDEPFADPSQIPTILLSRLTKESVTVALSGDGGDELFVGYERYRLAKQVWSRLQFFPSIIAPPVKVVLQTVPQPFWNLCYHFYQQVRGSPHGALKDVGQKVHRLSQIIDASSVGELYKYGNHHWLKDDHPAGISDAKTMLQESDLESRFDNSDDYFTYLDIHTYLPDDILTKVDRASMSCSLEARVPLLDHRIVEYARRLPLQWRVSQGDQKRILKGLLSQYVPRAAFERPKTGFGIPLPDWLRGPLRDWGEGLLDLKNLPHDGRLERGVVIDAWSKHQSNQGQLHYPLWDVLIFQDWLSRWHSHIET